MMKIPWESRPTSAFKCGCDLKMKKIIKDHHTNLQVSFLMMPSMDVFLALTFIDKMTADQINDQIDTFAMFQWDFNALYQVIFHAMEVFTTQQMLTLIEIKMEHEKH